MPFAAALASVVSLVAAAGPVFGPQTNQTIAELATLVVTNTATELGLSGGSGSSLTNTFIFDYESRVALLQAGWNFFATWPDGTSRDTEITNTADGALVSYDQNAHPGMLRIPCDVGDLWGSLNSSRNSLFRGLPTNWVSMQLALALAPTIDFQQVHLAVYQDDDNFVQAGFAYNSGLGGLVTTLIWEFDGTPNHYFQALNPVTSIRLRLDRDSRNGDITQLYSVNGTSWTSLGTTNQMLVNPRLCIWVGGSPVSWTNGLPSCDLQRLDVVLTNPAAPPISYRLVDAPAGASIDGEGVITWTPSEAQGPSTNLFTTVATDNREPPQSATNSFTVVVDEVNTAPMLPVVADRTVVGPALLVVTNTAVDSDVPSNTLSYQLLTAPANAEIDSNGLISWAPTDAQLPSTNVFVTVASDSNPWAVNAQQLSATNLFTVFALPPPPPPGPILPAQPEIAITEGSPLLVTNAATDSTLVSQILTNTFSFVYSNRDALLAGGWSFVATLPDGTSRDTEITNIDQGALIAYDQSAEPGILQIPCDLGDLWASINSTRNTLFRNLPPNWLSIQLDLSFTPFADYQQAHLALYQDDDNYLQIGAAYNGGPEFTMDLETSGFPNAFATAPFFTTSYSLRLDHDPTSGEIAGYLSTDGANWNLLGRSPVPFSDPRLAIWTGGSQSAYTKGSPNLDLRTLYVVVSNSLPASLTYQLIDAPAGMSIDTNGVITWVPGEADGPGTNVITTVVTDSGTPPLSATNSFVVVVEELNSAPVLPEQTNQVLMGQQLLVVTNTATDTDLPENGMNYELAVAPTGAEIDTSGVIRWLPGIDQVPSTNVFTTVVTDDNPWAANERYLSRTNSFEVVVEPIHQGPELLEQPTWTVLELTQLMVTNAAVDHDVPVLGLSYSLLDPPQGMSIDTNGVITWVPGEADGPGTNVITTVVTDSGTPPLRATNSFVVVVEELNSAPVLPEQTNQVLMGQQSLVVTNTATDTDLPENGLTYELAVAPTGAEIDTNGVIRWLPGIDQVPSTNVFTTVVTDDNPWAANERHLSAMNSFAVAVMTPAPLLIESIKVQRGLAIITWESVPGQTYELQYADDKGLANWKEIQPPVVASGPLSSVTNAIGKTSSRFYRVVRVP